VEAEIFVTAECEDDFEQAPSQSLVAFRISRKLFERAIDFFQSLV